MYSDTLKNIEVICKACNL